MRDEPSPPQTAKRTVQKTPQKKRFSLFNLFHRDSSKSDLREYLEEAKENNVIDNLEADMIQGVLAVSEQKVRDIMIPKSQMIMLDTTMTFEQIIEAVMSSGHSRFPVLDGEEVIGILLAKDLLACFSDSKGEPFKLKSLLREPLFVPDSKPLDSLLKQFRTSRVHMFMVRNEYGEADGLVTIEDVLEEIVGDIDDEHDREETHIRKLDEKHWLVNGLTEVEDFDERFGTTFAEGSVDTVAGVVLQAFGYIPESKEHKVISGYDFFVKSSDARRIHTLVVSKKIKPKATSPVEKKIA